MKQMEFTVKQLAHELNTNKLTIHRAINKLGLQGKLHKAGNRYMLSESQAKQRINRIKSNRIRHTKKRIKRIRNRIKHTKKRIKRIRNRIKHTGKRIKRIKNRIKHTRKRIRHTGNRIR